MQNSLFCALVVWEICVYFWPHFVLSAKEIYEGIFAPCHCIVCMNASILLKSRIVTSNPTNATIQRFVYHMHILVIKRTHWINENWWKQIFVWGLWGCNCIKSMLKESADLQICTPLMIPYMIPLWYPIPTKLDIPVKQSQKLWTLSDNVPASEESLHFFWDCFPLTGKTMSCKTHLCFAIRFPMFDQFLTFLQFVIKTEMPSTG